MQATNDIVFEEYLYKEGKQWSCIVINKLTHAVIRVSFGKIGGKIQDKDTTITEGKNIGKANETTYLDQAISEAKSKVSKQKDKLYTHRLLSDDTYKLMSSFVNVRPMLAQSYDKHAHKIQFPCYLQPKLDGCVSGDTLVKTKEYGYKPIKWIVENKIKCKVASYLHNKIQYNTVLSWFLNREYDEGVVWYEIELESGEKLKLTGNHEVYLPELGCYRRVDELDDSQSLMVV